MNDESKGRWTVDRFGDGEAAGPRWVIGNGGWSCSLANLHSAPVPERHAAAHALVALIEAAEGTEPRNQPEPLPLLTGVEVMEAWDRGAAVERLTEDGWERWSGSDAFAAVHQIAFCTFAARVVEPPAPATRTIRADELRPGMTLASGGIIANVSICHTGDGSHVEADCGGFAVAWPLDEPFEVLTEGTDKP